MNDTQGTITCALGCWLVGLLAGALAAAALMVMGDWTFLQGVFAGFVVFLFGGGLISWILCRPLPAPGSARMPAAKPAPSAAAAASQPAVKPSKPLAGQAELAERKGDWKYEGDAPPKEAKKQKAAATPASDTANRPAMLSDAPREGGADNLKLIGGVGPKLEATLNELGIWHFDQVAALTKEDVAWVDERLRFKGRMERDDWIGQAKILAAGGDTEFSKKKRKS